jgi:hypothetical protein
VTYECNGDNTHIAIIYGSQPCPLCECSSEEACAHVRRAEKAEAKLDEWLQFEERSGWTLKEYCREKDPMGEISRLSQEVERLRELSKCDCDYG